MTTVILLESLLELSQMDGNCLLLLLIYLQAAWKLSFGVSRLEYIFWWSNSTFETEVLKPPQNDVTIVSTHTPHYMTQNVQANVQFLPFFLFHRKGDRKSARIPQRFFENWPGLRAQKFHLLETKICTFVPHTPQQWVNFCLIF